MIKLLESICIFSIVVFLFACGGNEEVIDAPCDSVTCLTGEECQNGTCVDTTTVSVSCEVCGTYEGSISSGGDSITFLPVANNEPIEPSPLRVEVIEDTINADSLIIVLLPSFTVEEQTTGTLKSSEFIVHYDFNTKELVSRPNLYFSLNIPGSFASPISFKLVDFRGTLENNEISGQMIIDNLYNSDSTDNKYEGTLYFDGELD